MTDAPLETPAVQPTQTSTTSTTPAPLPNSPEARTPDGTLKDAQAAESKPESKTPEPATPQVPDTYDFKDADPTVVEKATPVFKELGLSQEAAQKLVDLYNTQAKTSADAMVKQVNDMRTGWRDTIAKDPEMGPKLDAMKADIGRAKSTLFENDTKGLAAFNEAMDLTGAGDHPDIVHAWYRMAQRINEGTHVSGRGPSEAGQSAPNKAAKPSAAQAMYPNLPSATAH